MRYNCRLDRGPKEIGETGDGNLFLVHEPCALEGDRVGDLEVHLNAQIRADGRGMNAGEGESNG